MAACEFRVLGPVDVRVGDGWLTIPSARQRAILAELVLHIGQPISAGLLIREVWGEEAPASAQHALRVHVSGLRRTLGPGWIETASGGYRLIENGCNVDLAAFERLAGEADRLAGLGQSSVAATTYREALALWRGPALADLESSGSCRADRARLDERRAAVTERWIDAELAAGRHVDLIPELRRIVAQTPYRETFQARLMLALYRSGRQAEALAVYREARALLDRDLGVDPGPDLEALQQAILAQDDSLLGPPVDRPVAAQSPAAPRPIDASTGRAAEAPADPRTAIADAPAGTSAGRRTITALVLELDREASHAFGPDPESSTGPGSQTLEQVERIVNRHGGVVHATIGTSMLVLFGVLELHEDDALRAARAAVETGRVLDTARIGISTGEVVLSGATVTGALTSGVVGQAKLLSGGAAPGQILLDGATYASIRQAEVDVEPLPTAANHDDRRTGFRLVAVRDPSGRHEPRLDAPLVGRQRELRQLHEALERATGDQACVLFTLFGAAGVGKSRLVHEFIGQVRERATVARGRCNPYGGGAFEPLIEALRQALAANDGEFDDQVVERIRDALGDQPRAEVIAGVIASAMGLSDAPAAAEDTTWAIRTLFERVARRRPLVLVFDDIQWADPTFLRLVHHIVATTRDAPILILCIARPELTEEYPDWGGGLRSATSLELASLPDADVGHLIERLLPGGDVEGSVTARIADGADGNALYVEEFVRMLLDDGALQLASGTWTFAPDAREIATPSSILALLAARLAGLPDTEREVIQSAAVIGKIFTTSALRGAIRQIREAELEDALDGLVARELIRATDLPQADGEGYRFKHILIRDAAYASISKRDRIARHEQLAALLEANADPGGASDEIGAGHLEQAYRYRLELGPTDARTEAVGAQAADALARAATRARIRGQVDVAAALLVRASVLLPTCDPRRLRLLDKLNDARIWSGAFGLGRQSVAELLDLTGEPALSTLHWRGLLHLLMVDKFQSGRNSVSIAETAATAHSAIRAFKLPGDHDALSRAWYLVGACSGADGRYGEARGAYAQSAEHARHANDLQAESLGRIHVVSSDFEGPATVRETRVSARALLEWAQATGQRGTEAIGIAYLARVAAMEGAFEEARRMVAEAIAINLDLGRRLHQAADHPRWVAMVEWVAGTPDAAEPALREGIENLTQLGSSHDPFMRAEMARILVAQGRTDEAEQYIGGSEDFLQFDITRVVRLNTRALILSAHGNVEDAIPLAREAVAIASRMDGLVLRGRAMEDLAEILRHAGQPDEARDALGDALRLYEQKGATALTTRLRAQIGTLDTAVG